MMISKSSVLAIASILALSAVACGGGDAQTEPKTPETTSSPSTVTPPAAPTTPATTSTDTSSTNGTGSMGTTSGSGGDATGSTGSTSGSDASKVTLTDEQIVAIVTAANTGEVDQAKLAQTKAKDAKVKKFAAMMVKDHTDANTKGAALAKKDKLTPADSPMSTQLTSDSKSLVDSLKAQSGADFDKAYIDAQVKQHQQVLDAIDNQLLTNVKNADLKDMITAIRPKIEMHLKEAQSIQSSLGSGSGSSGASTGTSTSTSTSTGKTGTKK